MKKAYRQKKIREIITARSIERQEDLVGALNELGLQVTQATISRYALPVMQHRDEPDQLGTTIHDSLVQLKRSDRLLALAVRPGNGPVVANLIRRLTDRGVFTTIGDDSNVLVVCDTADDAQTLADYLNSLVG